MGSTPPDSVAARWPSLAPALVFAVTSATFAVFRNPASDVIWIDHMATPESWSLLQSSYAMRDIVAASRSSILPLLRFNRFTPPPHKPGLVHSGHASVSSAADRQTSKSRSAHVVQATTTVYSAYQAASILHPAAAMGFGPFPQLLSVPAGPRAHQAVNHSHFPAPGFTPPEESPPSVAVLHHCSRYPLDVRSFCCRSEERATPNPSRGTRFEQWRRSARDRPKPLSLGASTPPRLPVRQSTNKPKQVVHVRRSTHGSLTRPLDFRCVRDTAQAKPMHRASRQETSRSRNPWAIVCCADRGQQAVHECTPEQHANPSIGPQGPQPKHHQLGEAQVRSKLRTSTSPVDNALPKQNIARPTAEAVLPPGGSTLSRAAEANRGRESRPHMSMTCGPHSTASRRRGVRRPPKRPTNCQSWRPRIDRTEAQHRTAAKATEPGYATRSGKPNRDDGTAAKQRRRTLHAVFTEAKCVRMARDTRATPSSSGFYSTDESVLGCIRCRCNTAYPSMGFVPLQGDRRSPRLPNGQMHSRVHLRSRQLTRSGEPTTSNDIPPVVRATGVCPIDSFTMLN